MSRYRTQTISTAPRRKMTTYRKLDLLRFSRIANQSINVWRVQCQCMYTYNPPPTAYGVQFAVCPACNRECKLDYNRVLETYINKDIEHYEKVKTLYDQTPNRELNLKF